MIKFKELLCRKKWFLVALMIHLCYSGSAQDYIKKTFAANHNGQSVIFNKVMYVDDDGFLWYSTYNGIVKNLGGGDILFPLRYPEERIIPNVTEIIKTKSNHIITTTTHGIYDLNLNNGNSVWQRPYYPDTNERASFTSLQEGRFGELWFGTDMNYVFKYANGIMTPYKIEQSPCKTIDKTKGLKRKGVETGIAIEEILDDGSVIVQQLGSLYKIDRDTVSTLFYNTESNDLKTENKLVQNGYLFPRNKSGHYTLKNEKYTVNYIEEIDRQVVQIPQNAWVISNANKLHQWKSADLIITEGKHIKVFKVQNISNIEPFKKILEAEISDQVTYYYVDREGLLWAYSQNGMISIVQWNDSAFDTYLNDPTNQNSRISCRGLSEESLGNIYIYTYSGFFILRPGRSGFEKLDIKHVTSKNPIPQGIYDFSMTDDNTLWAYGDTPYVYKIDLKNLRYKEVHFKGMAHSDLFFTDMEPLNPNTLLLASNKGLYEFDTETHMITNISQLSKEVNLSDIEILEIMLTKNGETLWISTEEGIYGKNFLNGQTHYYSANKGPGQMLNDEIKVIFEDQQNKIWLGGSRSIQKIDEKNNVVINVDGFTPQITGMLDDEKFLWVGTFNGLMKIDKRKGTSQKFFMDDGLPENEFNYKSVFKAGNNRFFFGGINGLVSFCPENVTKGDKQYSLFLTEYEMFDQVNKRNKKDFFNLDKINSFNLYYNYNYLTLKFTINDFFNAEQNKYQYRIEEISDKWTEINNGNSVQLQGLAPGTYSLQVKGFASNGNPTNELRYKIVVSPAFYNTGMFSFLVIIFFMLIIFWWAYTRQQRIYHKYEQKNKILELESKAFRGQMNPHFIFNAINGIQSALLLEGEIAANKYFGEFSKLIRLTLDMNRIEFTSIADEIQYLKAYTEIEKLRLDGNLNVTFSIDPEFENSECYIPVMMFQPIIENAIIHGLTPKSSNRNLYIEFLKEEDFLKGIVIDNGIGREESQKRKTTHSHSHNSAATGIMKERMDIANVINEKKMSYEIEDLFDNNDVFLGTKVSLTIPLKYKM